MGKPLVSVIMPARDASAYIEQAIRSVMGQTVTDWELLVLDDCSEDSTRGIVSDLAREDPRIRLYANGTPLGTARTRNAGLALCAGEYVALLDSDDVWHPDKLEKQLALAKKEGAQLVYCSYALVDESGNKGWNDFVVPPDTDVKRMLKENVIGCSTVLLAGQLVKRFRFSEQYYHEDYVLWLDILRSGAKAVGVEEVLVDYRCHSSGRSANKFRCAKGRWRIYRSFLGLSVPRSAWYLAHYALAGFRKYRRR